MSLTALVPDEQRIAFAIEHPHPFLSAATVAGLIGNAEKLLRSVAKEIGATVHVFVERIEWTDTKFVTHFIIANAKSEVGKAMQAKLKGLAEVSQ